MSRLGAAAVLGLLAAFTATACGNDQNETHISDPLDRQVCAQADLGPRYNHQTAGDFSLRNLADLSNETGARLAAYRAAGMTSGHFAFWKEVAGRPPFDPPVDVVCEAIQFATSEQAKEFVAGLSPEDAARLLVARLPRHFVSKLEPTPPGVENRRSFRVTGESEAGPVTVVGVVVADGPYIRAVGIGGAGAAPQLSNANELERMIAGRQR